MARDTRTFPIECKRWLLKAKSKKSLKNDSESASDFVVVIYRSHLPSPAAPSSKGVRYARKLHTEKQFQVSRLMAEDRVAGIDEIHRQEHKSIWWTGAHHDFIRKAAIVRSHDTSFVEDTSCIIEGCT